ncbi:hypothetical protein EJ08DRAFT_736814 [Tothia fuscella]|uniref:Uncharacterized protein n=1 Tax=Tothia fuscella TaxID=1048955 RepID=A0A9P4NKM1_9PEZI|nr:hypothetical protein EJ08DRAFT_736814 [Tothia fuscella]
MTSAPKVKASSKASLHRCFFLERCRKFCGDVLSPILSFREELAAVVLYNGAQRLRERHLQFEYWQNTSDEPVGIAKPTLPINHEEFNEAEKVQVLQDYRRRQLHLLYLGATTRLNPTHMDAYLIKGLPYKRRIYEHMIAPWQGDNTTLKADLVLATQNWKGLTAAQESDKKSDKEIPQESVDAPDCPISFRQEEVDEALRLDLLLKGVNADMAGVRENIGIGSDGWVANEEYDGAVERNAYIKQQVVDQAESDEARELGLRHYPFNDHDEDE